MNNVFKSLHVKSNDEELSLKGSLFCGKIVSLKWINP